LAAGQNVPPAPGGGLTILEFKPALDDLMTMLHTSLMLVVVASAKISVSPANATMRSTGDRGGLHIAYAERFAAARANGEPVIIDGACLSACTLAIGKLPRGQVCPTPNAVLGFHAAAWRPTVNGGKVTNPVATQAMYDLYPANVGPAAAACPGGSSSLTAASLPQ
jgi:hypothetical protein